MYRTLPTMTLALLTLALPAFAADSPAHNLQVGQAITLDPPANSQSPAWTTRNPAVAQVFPGGYVFAIAPGRTTLQATPDHAVTINVTPAQHELVDPASLRQYPDDRRFQRAADQECYGCELNCRQPGREGTSANRVINPDHPGHRLYWLVQPDTPVVDGQGILIGTIAPVTFDGKTFSGAKFNHGMTKIINNQVHLYTFATKVIPAPQRNLGNDPIGVSAWLPLKNVIHQQRLLDLFDVGSGQMPHLPLEDQSYRITGGSDEQYVAPNGKPLSIIKNYRFGAVPQHYLRRPAGTINIIYAVPGFSLGGHGLDSFLIDDANLTFRPAKGVRRFPMPTYWPVGHPNEGEISGRTMTFVYGAVNGPNTDPVYGWIAAEALENPAPLLKQ